MMVVSTVTLLCVVVYSCSVFAAEEKQDIYAQASKCPYRFQMGCFLDVLEKSCTGYQFVEACAKKGQCKKNKEELQGFIGALDPKEFEALHKCCCTKAFKEGGYEDCKKPNPVCMKALADHVDKDLAKHVKVLKACFKKPNKSTCTEALNSATAVNVAIQKARGVMWPTDGCKMLAPSEPISTCGWGVKPAPRAIERSDLYCDTIIWQFKEMGASDPYMAQCKDAPAMPQQQESHDGHSHEGEEGEEEEHDHDPRDEKEEDDHENEKYKKQFNKMDRDL